MSTQKTNFQYIVALSFIITLAAMLYVFSQGQGFSMNYKLKNHKEISGLFPKNISHLLEMIKRAKEDLKKQIEDIIAIDQQERTFENTIRAVDNAISFDFNIPFSIISCLPYILKDENVRNEARIAAVDLEKFLIDHFQYNQDLYHAIKSYKEMKSKEEDLTKEEEYFLTELIRDFERNGLGLPQKKQDQIKQLKKQLAELGTSFEQNINNDQSFATATKSELEGLEESFIKNLKKNDQDLYILGMDYPTYFSVMEQAHNINLRKRMFCCFNQRAYPQNNQILKLIIEKRAELAQLLGFKSYTHLILDNSMAKTVENVENFLKTVLDKAIEKEKLEMITLLDNLPSGIEPSDDGKLAPWDRAYIYNNYKKKKFNIDNREIASYFPMEKTIENLLSIYQKFFDITLTELPAKGLFWDDEVRLIEVSTNGKIIGYLLLDLFPRAHKYSHACQMTLIPALAPKKNAESTPALALVLANFSKPLKEKPSLLELQEVRTFFHEFGHALHALLGATSLASCSGTNVKKDFVEMPSQMLEEWLWDFEILKDMSHHYLTENKIPDETVINLIKLRNLNSGSWLTRQIYFSYLSLYCFNDIQKEGLEKLIKKLYTSIRPFDIYHQDDHHEASFGHLIGYGPSYYGYLWSQVYSHDLFNHIKKNGLLNKNIGLLYKEHVLSKGGSADPQELLQNFLGRQPTADAFFINMGLN